MGGWRSAQWRIAVLLIVGLAAGVAVLVFVPASAHPPLTDVQLRGITPERQIELQQAQSQLRDGLRTGLLQAVAGAVILLGALATWRQVRVNQDGHVTAHFSRAVEQTGEDNIDVRIGGIYALERIARTSAQDRTTIIFMLASFVRNHAGWTGPHPSPDVDMSLPWLRLRQPDVQAAMNAIGRQAAGRSSGRLYLTRTDLRSLQLNDGIDLTDSNFNHANLARVWLRGVILRRCGFKNCDLRHANLERADLREADLRGAHLSGANLRDADLRDADLRDADLRDADLRGADLRGADLRGADLRGADLRGADLRAADLRGGNVAGLDLGVADLTGALLDPAPGPAAGG